jgi:hypothetical protein
MADALKVKPPISRVRYVIGLILIIMGAALWADMGWLWALFGSGFGHDEWVRFGFWLWVGAVLALAGVWLAYRSRVAGWAIGPVFAALFIVIYIHDHWLR